MTHPNKIKLLERMVANEERLLQAAQSENFAPALEYGEAVRKAHIDTIARRLNHYKKQLSEAQKWQS